MIYIFMTGPFGTFLMVFCFITVCITNSIGMIWIYLLNLIQTTEVPGEDLNANECAARSGKNNHLNLGS